MRETVVEKHLRKQVIAHGGWIRKMVWPGHRGAPDRLVIWPARTLGLHVAPADGSPVQDFVECKRPKGPIADHQVREHDKLRKLGCTVYVLDTAEAVDTYIRERTS